MKKKWLTMAQNNTGHIYTVSHLTKEIKSLLETTFPFVWVAGEISNYATPASGHSYFTLKDSTAVISAVMFKNQKRNLKFVPENGMKVFGLSRISLYEPRGSYQLIFEHLEPDGTGSLQVAFEQLKAKLSDQGLFDEKYKQPIVFLPSKVCIITSPTGAAIRDIINVSQRRYPNCCIDILPVKVQGVEAPHQIVNAIQFANTYYTTDGVADLEPDVIILARGGGSIEDLAAFNSEDVARAIFDSKIPMVTGVGHETDFTIADFVSDLRAPTPSAAAEIVFPEKQALVTMIDKFKLRMQTSISQLHKAKVFQFDQLFDRLKTPMNLVYDSRLKLEDDQTRLSHAMVSLLKFSRVKLDQVTQSFDAVQPQKRIQGHGQKLALLTNVLNYAFYKKVQDNKSKYKQLYRQLEALSPQAVLERGYSITQKIKDKTVVTHSDDVADDDKIQIILAKGKLTARVTKSNG